MFKNNVRPGAHERSAFTHPPRDQGFRPNRQHPVAEAPKNLASAIRVKNFRRLLEVAGDENLGVALDLTIPRVKELAEGVNFSNETTHHIETILGLSSGFLDQVNPTLTERDLARLKSPSQAELPEEPPSAPRPQEAVSPTTAVLRPAPDVAAPQVTPLVVPAAVDEPEPVPAQAQVAGPAIAEPPLVPVSVSLSNAESSVKETFMPRIAKSAAQAQAPVDASQAAPVEGTAEEVLREVRRLNLLTLTHRAGAKTQLGRLTGLSAANVSHRLHGNKIFDRETADFFCERLGMPQGWFETTRTEGEIPEATLKLLSDKSAPSAAPLNPSAKSTKAVRAAPPALAPTVAQVGAVSLSPGALGKSKPASAVAPVAPVSAAPVSAAPAAAPRPLPVARPAPAAPAASQAAPASTPVTSMASQAMEAVGGGVGPIAEALIRTLASKSREGRLGEDRALQLLVEAASL